MEKKVTAWVARDEDRILFMYTHKPKKDKAGGVWYLIDEDSLSIDEDYFPEVKWEDEEPTEVELTIRIK